MSVPADEHSRLRGRTILIAESCPLIALDLSATISAWGAQPVMHHELGHEQRQEAFADFSAALVDVDLCVDEHAKLVDALRQRGVPTVLTTAWHKEVIRDKFPGLAVFEKPVDFAELAQWFAEHG